MVAVKVRQGTLSAHGRGRGTESIDARGGGPTENTGRGGSQLRADTGHGGWRLMRADSKTTKEETRRKRRRRLT